MQIVRANRLAERLAQPVQEIEDERFLDLDFFLRTFEQPDAPAKQDRGINPAGNGYEQQPAENNRPHRREATLLRGRFLMEVLLQIIENVFEPGNIFRRGFAQRLVRLQHGVRLFAFLVARRFRGRFSGKHFTFRRGGAVGMNIEQLIKTQAGEQLVAARPAVNDVKMPLPKFLQTQRHSSHGPHEGRIHHRAIGQIDNKFAVTAIDHLARELFQVPAVQKIAPAFDFNPDRWAIYTDLNRGFHRCE